MSNCKAGCLVIIIWDCAVCWSVGKQLPSNTPFHIKGNSVPLRPDSYLLVAEGAGWEPVGAGALSICTIRLSTGSHPEKNREFPMGRDVTY